MLNSSAKPEKLVDLHIRVNKDILDKIMTVAGTRKETAAVIIRRTLAAGLNAEIAESMPEPPYLQGIDQNMTTNHQRMQA